MMRSASRRLLLAGGGGLALGLLLGPSVSQAENPTGPVRVRDLYDKDRSLSDLVDASLGQRIEVRGFMAPPLKAESNFFVLTARPMTTCPFCSTEAEWPDDIVAVYTKRPVRAIAFNIDIVVRGRLESGAHTDPETGFVSLLRLADAVYHRR